MDGCDENFESVESGASDTFPMQCSALRKNGHVMLKGHACRIVDMSTSKTGKHGHAKVHLTGIDIFSGKKYEDICPSTHNMNVPNVVRKDYSVAALEESYVHLMDDDGTIKEDLKLPENDLGKEIRTKYDADEEVTLTVVKAMGMEKITGIKGGMNKSN